MAYQPPGAWIDATKEIGWIDVACGYRHPAEFASCDTVRIRHKRLLRPAPGEERYCTGEETGVKRADESPGNIIADKVFLELGHEL
jgi:hypothetical protein